MVLKRTGFFGVVCVGLVMAATEPAIAGDPVPTAPAPKTPGNTTGAQFVVENPVASFGSILDYQPVSLSWKFKNTGGTKLVISKLRSLCECVVPTLDKFEFGPGEEGVIKADFNPKGRRGNTGIVVYVESNDVGGTPIELTVSGQVKPTVAIDPRVLRFGQVAEGKSATVKATITGRTADFAAQKATIIRQPKLFDVKVLDTVDIEERGEKLRRTTIELTLKAGAPNGNLVDELDVATNDPRMKTATVTVIAWVGNEAPPPPPVPVIDGPGGRPLDRMTVPSNKSPSPAPAPAPAPAPTPKP